LPKLNIDKEYQGIFESIEFTLDEVEYSVTKIETSTMEALMDSADTDSARTMKELFASLVGVDKKEFNKTDFRKLSLAMRFINTCMQEQIDKFTSKNEQGESAPQKA